MIDQHSADLPKLPLATLKDPVIILNRGHGTEEFYRAAKRASTEHILSVVAKGDTPRQRIIIFACQEVAPPHI